MLLCAFVRVLTAGLEVRAFDAERGSQDTLSIVRPDPLAGSQ